MRSFFASEQSVFKPLLQKKAFAQIADQIKHLILQKVLKPGDKLPSERELAAQFKVGRISVREALRTLEQGGLILIRQGSEGGAFVKEVDIDFVSESISQVLRRANLKLDDVIEVRVALEKVIIEKASEKMNEKDLEELKKNIQEAESILEKSAIDSTGRVDLGLIVRTNMEFHFIVARATRNPLYELVMESLMKATNKFMPESAPPLQHHQHHLKCHKAIYQALRERNVSSAKKRLDSHNRALKRRFMESAKKVKKHA
ncbi:MAG: FadR family transcriptional regulator [Deltaproteobacteria bacterium]|nr:FadR family transcriptional regulator [Deltaproteobacteria bacterium]